MVDGGGDGYLLSDLHLPIDGHYPFLQSANQYKQWYSREWRERSFCKKSKKKK